MSIQIFSFYVSILTVVVNLIILCVVIWREL